MSVYVHTKRTAAIFFIVLFALLSATAYAEPLHDAAMAGDLNKVREIIDKGADVNEKDKYGNTALHLAALFGKADAASLLIEKGANVNAKDNYNNTVLHAAAFKGNTDIVLLLIDKGADVNANAADGLTPLHMATGNDKTDLARLLINKGADVNAKIEDGSTPLHFAASQDRTDMVSLLIKNGADVNAEDNIGWTPLHFATRDGKTDTASLLIEKGADINAKSNAGLTPLHVAAEMGKTDTASLLIEKGADVNAKAADGLTPLHWAAWMGKTDTASLLIEKGADVNAMAEDGMTALMMAEKKGRTKTAQLLRSAGRARTASLTQPHQTAQATPVQPQQTAQPKAAQPASDIDLNIPRTSAKNPNAIAIVIGNRDYKNRDVPSVDYAINDAEAVKKYLISVLGYKDGNVISLQNATKAELEAHFGTKDDHKGILYNYLKPGQSDIFIYYSGHGAPDLETKKGYFVPSDANPQAIKLSGYPIDTLYANLAKTAKEMASPNVFIVIDACFSGATEKGLLMKNASPITVTVANPLQQIPNAVVMTSSSASEISSWYPEGGHSMFTYFFLKSLKDNASKPGLTAGELFTAVSDTSEGVPYYARRMYGRSQTPQMTGDKGRVLR